MKISLQWAQYFSNVDLRTISDELLVSKIGSQIGEVEGVEDWGKKYKGVVVAKVVSCEPHPNADKLHVCRIDDGGVVEGVERDTEGLVQVVCGAPNVTKDVLVAWLPPGATVPSTLEKDPFVLEARELRGVVSNGMLASLKELGIADDHSGILLIDSEEVGTELAKPGTPFEKLYGLDDLVIDIENKMFTHRPDCFGVLGVAREIAGIQSLSFESPKWYTTSPQFSTPDLLPLRVMNEAPDSVYRFMAVAMKNVRMIPSPIWLQAGLTRVGIRPINYLVDLTNFYMHLTGQPMHAYDYDKVKALSGENATLVAREATKSEKLTLLSGKEVLIDAPSLVIATDKEVIGLAGVMGGANTEVDETTTNIILECASFDMYSIRRTAMKYGLFTDAVTRFTKGQSPLQNDYILAKIMDDIIQNTGAEQASVVYDLHNELPSSPAVTVSTEFINDRLGSELSSEQIAKLLQNVEFSVATNDAIGLSVTAPFWRTDIEQPEDIVEEVGRLYGYDNLPIQLPTRSSSPSRQSTILALKSRIRSALTSAGANEVLTYSFVHGDLLEKVSQPVDQAYKLTNAISPDLQYFRLSIIPSLLDKVYMNVRAGFDEFGIFELNKSHVKQHGLDELQVPKEIEATAFVFAASDKHAKQLSGSAFYYARAYLDEMARQLGLKLVYDAIDEESAYPVAQPFDQTRSAMVRDSRTGTVLGMIGEFKQSTLRSLKLPKFTAGFELGTDLLLGCVEDHVEYMPLSKFPSTEQDICLQVDSSTTYAALQGCILDALAFIAKEKQYRFVLTPVDVYRTEASSQKNITFRITLSHPERTLVTQEINELLEHISTEAHDRLAATRQ